jgi:spoIIIJ-associated protein
MLKWIETTGKTDEAAVAAALAQLGLDRDEVSVEILDRAKSGFLGLRGTPARVKVSYEAPDEPEEAPKPAAKQPQEKPESDRGAAPRHTQEQHQTDRRSAEASFKAPPAQEKAPAFSEGDADRAGQITAFLTGLMTHMSVSATPVVTENPEGGYQVVLEGNDLGALIGRRGETLDAIQQLTNYAVNRGQSKRIRVHIDAERYRSKREESLQRLAQKVAGKVVKYHRNVTLEPMNAYERHVIHAALQDFPDVVTYSTGTEPNRRTVVAYSKGEHKY